MFHGTQWDLIGFIQSYTITTEGKIHLHLRLGTTYFKIQKIPKIVAHVHVQLFSHQ